MKLGLFILIGSILTAASFGREATNTEWRKKQPLSLLAWCIELNPHTDATTRYFLGAPDKKEEYKKTQGVHGPSELWIYDLPGNRFLEVVMMRKSPKGFAVHRVSYSFRLPGGMVSREDWHFHPDWSQPEKNWRLIAPTDLSGNG